MSITFILILLTSIISLGGLFSPKFHFVFNRFGFSPFLVKNKYQFYRFITSGFLHANLYHLIFNLVSLYAFGDILESYFKYYFGEIGAIYFLTLYCGGLVFSNLPSYLMYNNSGSYFSLGASGGVSAIVFSTILISPTSTICLFMFICFPGFIFAVLYIMFSIYAIKNDLQPRINHLAHIAGGIFGLVFTAILEPKFILFFYHQIKIYFKNIL